MFRNVSIPMAGGLGDILMYYCEGDLGYFKGIKQRWPDITTKVLTYSVSDQVHHLFAHHPFVDVHEHCPWPQGGISGPLETYALGHAHPAPPNGGGWTWLSKHDKSLYDLTSVRDPFYLDLGEAEVAAYLEERPPYVVVHPFAGSPDRDLASRREINFPRMIRALADNCHVVLLGGSSYRGDQARRIVESAELPWHANLTNLVNHCSVRLHAHVTSKASKFIGTVSAYNCVAQQYQVPSQLWTTPRNAQLMRIEKNGVFMLMRENDADVISWDHMPEDPISEMVRFARS